MRITFLVIFALSVIIPIGVNDAFGAFMHDNNCNSLKHIPNNSWKLFLCSTVEINGDTSGITLTNTDHFGDSVANIGDLDGDGVNDLAVGAKRDDAGPGTDAGAVHILFMNADGSVKSTEKIDHTTANGPTLRTEDRFGDSIVNIGDLNGDGINDLAVGAVNDDTKSNGTFGGQNWDAGAVHILFLNRDGTLARATAVINSEIIKEANEENVLATGDAFGMGVANIGDLDNNGYNDLAVGAMLDGDRNRGAVHILFMDENGGLAKATEIIDGSTTNGPTLGNGYWFGGSVANIGDFDGNGVNDLVVGANLSPGGGLVATGAVYILFMDEDPGNGLAKATVVIDGSTTNGPTLSDDDRFGASVVNMGDIDGDGVNDIAVGARGDDEGGSWTGAVHILFMNAGGSVDSTVEINSSTDKGPTLSAGDAFGTGLAHIGDMNDNGVNDLVVGANLDNGDGSDRGAVHILFLTDEIEKVKSDCYDCEAPKLTKVEVHITSPNSDTQRISTSSEIWHFDQDTPLPMFGDSITPIVADLGDEVEIILELTDNRTLKTITDSGTYTNFLNKPDDMNLFYANNFDEYGKVSTTFYEWYQTGDDLFYDYANTVEWSDADVTIQESGEFVKDGPVENLDELVGTFTISFKMKFLQPMQTTDVWIQVADLNGNFFKVALPLTLEVSGSEPLVFDSPLRQKVVSFFDEKMLDELVSNWDGSSQDVAELELLIGIPAESVPKWIVNLATWVSEDKITAGDMIIAIEHIINN
jgi:hypothetical protein